MTIQRRFSITIPINGDGVSTVYSIDVSEAIHNAGILPRVPNSAIAFHSNGISSVSLSGTVVTVNFSTPLSVGPESDLVIQLLIGE